MSLLNFGQTPSLIDTASGPNSLTVSRYLVGAFLIFLAIPGIMNVTADAAHLPSPSMAAGPLAHLLAQSMATLFLLATAFCALRQLPAQIQTWRARPVVTAIGGGFLLVGFSLLPQHLPSTVAATTGALLVGSGYVAASVSLIWLGRSFSILPSARRLVVNGPFRWVRHPLYVAEEFVVLGLLFTNPCWGAVALAILHGALQFDRLLHEEAVLTAAFPDYRAYAARTARFVPGLI